MGKDKVFYDPAYVLNRYKREPNVITRAYLHLLMHCIFNHAYRYEKMHQELWDIAADMAVENAILELGLSGLEVFRDEKRKEVLSEWKNRVGVMTADRIYKKLLDAPIDPEDIASLRTLFFYDILCFPAISFTSL